MMKWSFALNLEIPSKKNSRVTDRRTGRSFPNKRYTEWHRTASMLLRSQNRPVEPIDAPCIVSIELTRGDARRRDIDNSTGSIFDLLVDNGILKDDSDKIVKVLRVECVGVRKNDPLCVIRINDYQ